MVAQPELVEVRTEPVDGVETPTQLLRQGRLWLVRSAERRLAAGQGWRVHAGPGAEAAAAVLDLQPGANGRWSLTELDLAAPAEVAEWG
jgi:hypothetical protein